MINLIPLPYRIMICIAAAIAVFGAGWYKGSSSVHAEWESAKLKQELVNSMAATKEAEQAVQVVTQYVDRVKVVHDKGEVITKEVKVYVSDKDDAHCSVPNGFWVLWNAANKGELPAAAGDSNEATGTVVLSDVATQHAREAEICRETEQQLISLQEWIRGAAK